MLDLPRQSVVNSDIYVPEGKSPNVNTFVHMATVAQSRWNVYISGKGNSRGYEYN